MPFYRAENLEGIKTTDSAPGVFPFVRGIKADNVWLVCQDIDAKDAKAANAKASMRLVSNSTNSSSTKSTLLRCSTAFTPTASN